MPVAVRLSRFKGSSKWMRGLIFAKPTFRCGLLTTTGKAIGPNASCTKYMPIKKYRTLSQDCPGLRASRKPATHQSYRWLQRWSWKWMCHFVLGVKSNLAVSRGSYNHVSRRQVLQKTRGKHWLYHFTDVQRC